jgi:hypothetical protein
MPTSLTDLPIELIERILTFAPAPALASCALTSHLLHSLVTTSISLRYSIACHNARVADNPSSALDVSTKLSLLLAREAAWLDLKPTFTRTIKCGFSSGSLYDLSNGVFVLGESSRQSLHWIQLPRSEEEQCGWRTVQLDDVSGGGGAGGGYIVDFGLSVYEHDLIVVVSS